MNILIVDHSKVFRTMWERTILPLGHESIAATTGRQGLDVLRERRVDLVCVALSLPDMDGVEFCRELRALPQQQSIPVIALTSTVDKKLRERCFAAGFTELHNKTNLDSLVSLVKRMAREHTHQLSGRVLYVEDSSTVAHVMLKILRGMKLEVDHFKSAEEAFSEFNKTNYDLIISDIMVEGEMTGMGLFDRIRGIEGDKSRVPILAVSGMDDTARRIELFRLGVNDFITKPVIKEEVIARVTNLITNKQLFDQVKAQQKHLYELAMTDQLTGLYNRNSLAEFAKKYFSEAKRHDLPLSVIILDLDHFKEINDRHGHLTGDTVLEQVGELLRQNCREEDFAARFGGEEFLLILTHCTLDAARDKAENLRRQLEQLQPAGITVTGSFGVTARPAGERINLDDVLRAADQAVYEAKRQGRNQVVSRPAAAAD